MPVFITLICVGLLLGLDFGQYTYNRATLNDTVATVARCVGQGTSDCSSDAATLNHATTIAETAGIPGTTFEIVSAGCNSAKKITGTLTFAPIFPISGMLPDSFTLTQEGCST